MNVVVEGKSESNSCASVHDSWGPVRSDRKGKGKGPKVCGGRDRDSDENRKRNRRVTSGSLALLFSEQNHAPSRISGLCFVSPKLILHRGDCS